MWTKRLQAFLIFGSSFALAAYIVANKPLVDHVLAAAGPFAILVAVVIFALVASAPFSVTDALAISNGVLFGPWLGSAVNAAGIILAAVAGYYVALRTSKLLDIEREIERLPNWIRRFEVGSPMFLIVVRVLPGMGGTIATQVAATLRVSMWRQVYTMCAVAVPVCTVLAFGGHAISTYVQTHFVTPAEKYAAKHHFHLPRVFHSGPPPTALPSALALPAPAVHALSPSPRPTFLPTPVH